MWNRWFLYYLSTCYLYLVLIKSYFFWPVKIFELKLIGLENAPRGNWQMYSNHNQSVNIKMSTKTSFLIRRRFSDGPNSIYKLHWTFTLDKNIFKVQLKGCSKFFLMKKINNVGTTESPTQKRSYQNKTYAFFKSYFQTGRSLKWIFLIWLFIDFESAQIEFFRWTRTTLNINNLIFRF